MGREEGLAGGWIEVDGGVDGRWVVSGAFVALVGVLVMTG
jgi:hypothetical protein